MVNQSIKTSSIDDVQKSINLMLINKVLIGMTEVLHRRETELKRVGHNSYYDSEFIKHLVTDEQTNELWSFLNTQV
jgi:hypothetical protein